MKLSLLIAFLTPLMAALPAWAEIRLVEWHTRQTLAPLIIPVRSTETPEQASERYLKNLSQSPDLMELFLGQTPHLETVAFRELKDQERESRILLLANAAKDTTRNSERIVKFKTYFEASHQKSFILPINSNLGLSLGETRELFQRISENFPMMVAMGGEDVDPVLYKNQNIHSMNVIPERDRFEVNLIKSYVTSAKGFLLGVCRGSQITAVALGYELVQDIPTQILNNMDHKDGWHDIKPLKTTYSLLKSSSAQQTMSIRSIHHQSVRFKEGGPLEIAAVAADGVVEATEFKNGRGLLVQFHPELMNNSLGAQILTQAVKAKNRMMPRTCSGVFL